MTRGRREVEGTQERMTQKYGETQLSGQLHKLRRQETQRHKRKTETEEIQHGRQEEGRDRQERMTQKHWKDSSLVNHTSAKLRRQERQNEETKEKDKMTMG